LDATGVEDRGADVSAGRRCELPLPNELRALWIASAVSFALAFVVGWFKWHAGQAVYNWDPLSDPRFGDLLEYPGTFALFHTKAFFFNVMGKPWAYPLYSPVAYPPFAVAMMAPIYLSGQPELVFVLLSAAWLGTAVLWVRRWMVRGGIGAWTAILFPLTLAAVSFPIARLVHQGNIELIVWMLTAAGTWAWVRDRNGTAAVFWGCAAAMKLFPLVLLALLLPRRKWRAFLLGLAMFVVATVWSLWWLGPTVADAWHGSMVNVFGYQATRVSEWTLRELVANHSAIEIAKLGAMIAGYPLKKLAVVYYGLGAAVFTAAFFGKLWRMPAVNQLLAVSAFMVMFPAISYYHALVHMYAALVMLGWVAIRAQRAGVHVPALKATILLFVPLFVAFPVLTFPTAFLFCGLLQAIVLVLLFLCALQYRFDMPEAPAA